MFLKLVDMYSSFSWNSIIRKYELSGRPWESIKLFHEMICNAITPDKFTFPFVLKACANVNALKEGEQIHCRIVKTPHKFDMFVQCFLIDMYAKCGKIEAARASFDYAHNRNVFCWNVMIDGYVKNGDIGAASLLFDVMPERDLFSWNVMLDGYAKVGQLKEARKLFDGMIVRDVITWNSMIDGYAKFGHIKDVKDLFHQMPIRDSLSWGIMLNAYARCGQVETAHSLFQKLPHQNSITWNSLIRGYALSGNITSACKLFELMLHKTLPTWNTMLDGYVKNGEMVAAMKLFDAMPAKDTISWNVMIDGFARAGNMEYAVKLFSSMPCRDIVSWNAIIGGYKQNGQHKKVMELHSLMQCYGEQPDSFTLATVLSSSADLGLLEEGRSVHAFIKRNHIPVNGIVAVALIDMYSKCGHVKIAFEIFNSISCKTTDHWNVMISGAATHGFGNLAVDLFKQMENLMVAPDSITFIAVLNACSHAGLVQEGQFLFEHMTSKYGITPNIQHYGCMVDLLSRAGQLEAAMTLVDDMPFTPNDVMWRAILGAARNHGNTQIAEHAAKHLVELVPHDSSSYVLLSNMYGSVGQQRSAGSLWNAMKDRGVVKTPGCSSVEVKCSIHEFIVGDTSYPDSKEMLIV